MKKSCLLRLIVIVLAVALSMSLSTQFAAAAEVADTVNEVGTAGDIVPAAAPADGSSDISDFKAEVLRLVNAEREKVGAAALVAMDGLDSMADIRAEESNIAFKHTRPDGTRCFTIYADYSMTYRAAGENLAYGFKMPADVVSAWMNSDSHKRNILDPDFEYIGIGYYVNANGRIYCSQLFYTPK